MSEERIEKLFDELAQATTESVPSHLVDEIKNQIPQRLTPHRGGIDTVNIIIDLRISKLAAAAAIIITMILFANFFGGRSQDGDELLQSGKLLMRYCLGDIDAGKGNISAARTRYEYLAQKGEDVVYYGDKVNPQDSNAVLIQWKLPDGRYKVVFGDLREETVNAEELIKLQAQMLQGNGKR
ncbi:MAG: hypothetical protein PHY02_03130 [Phycisphaerae bacterium]|nr:hypothetical protein [Phycisphaerae bacterium]